MKKVVYSVSRYRKEEIVKLTGLGYITDTDLIIACVSQKGNPISEYSKIALKIVTLYPEKPENSKVVHTKSEKFRLIQVKTITKHVKSNLNITSGLNTQIKK